MRFYEIPSRQISNWLHGRYVKTVQGGAIADRIGIDKMRSACPNFNDWLNRLGCYTERALQSQEFENRPL